MATKRTSNGLRECKVCGEKLPADREHFYINTASCLRTVCIECTKTMRNKTGQRRVHRVPERDGLRQCQVCFDWFPADLEHFDNNNGWLQSACKWCRRAKYADWRERRQYGH